MWMNPESLTITVIHSFNNNIMPGLVLSAKERRIKLAVRIFGTRTEVSEMQIEGQMQTQYNDRVKIRKQNNVV